MFYELGDEVGQLTWQVDWQWETTLLCEQVEPVFADWSGQRSLWQEERRESKPADRG